jgi:hypothetical protein
VQALRAQHLPDLFLAVAFHLHRLDLGEQRIHAPAVATATAEFECLGPQHTLLLHQGGDARAVAMLMS